MPASAAAARPLRGTLRVAPLRGGVSVRGPDEGDDEPFEDEDGDEDDDFDFEDDEEEEPLRV
jgi:hypothetical protein